MDFLTHTCAGWTIGRCFPSERWGSWVTPTAMIAANLPDGETFFVPRGATYLLYHRGWSHSLLGIAMEVVGFSLLVMLTVWFSRRRTGNRAPPRLDRILILVAVCAYSHLLLDWWNTYGVRPFYPFDKSWYYGDLAVLWDPWIWLLIAGPLFLATRFRDEKAQTVGEHDGGSPTSLRTWGLVVLWGFVCVYVGIYFQRAFREISSPAVPIVWSICVAAVIGAKLTCARRVPARRAAWLGMILVGVYLGALAGFGRRALNLGVDAFQSEHANVIVTDASSNPVFDVPWRRHVLVVTDHRIYQYRVNVMTGEISNHREFERNLDDPGIPKIKDRLAYIAWRSFARHPIARREEQWLVLGDARYAVYETRGDWTEQKVEVD